MPLSVNDFTFHPDVQTNKVLLALMISIELNPKFHIKSSTWLKYNIRLNIKLMLAPYYTWKCFDVLFIK